MEKAQVTLQEITADQVEVLKKGYSGKNLEAVLKGVEMINESVRAGGWLPKYSRTATAAFSKPTKMASKSQTVRKNLYRLSRADGISREEFVKQNELYNIADDVFAAATYLHEFPKAREFQKISHLYPAGAFDYLTELDSVVTAIRQTIKMLNSLRPAPVITPIGVSPKVQATLKECNLDVDLNSICLPEIVLVFEKRARKNGGEEMVPNYKIIWPEDTKHNQSRFSVGCRCQACGKPIHSGRFVPVQAKDNNLKSHISLWVGEDCAKKIFGIKAEGFILNKEGAIHE